MNTTAIVTKNSVFGRYAKSNDVAILYKPENKIILKGNVNMRNYDNMVNVLIALDLDNIYYYDNYILNINFNDNKVYKLVKKNNSNKWYAVEEVEKEEKVKIIKEFTAYMTGEFS